MTTIIIKNSSTSSAVPVSGDLTKGELAVNVTDKKLYTKDNGGSVVKLVGGLGNQEASAVAITGGAIDGTPIGGTTASTASFTTLSASGNVTLSGGTANGVLYLNGSKVATSGSALTFDGSQLGVGVASPVAPIEIQSNSGATAIRIRGRATANSGSLRYFSNDGATQLARLEASDNAFEMGGIANIPLTFLQNGSEAMRLTSTGLGIGTSSPAAKLDVLGSSGDQIRVRTAGTEYYRFGRNASTGYMDFYGSQTGYQGYTFGGVDGTWMTISSSGNLGLGVTPSAWESSYRVMQLASTGAFVAGRTTTTAAILGSNASRDTGGTWRYTGSAPAARLEILDGTYAWYTAASGTAGDPITFTQAMTLDASGNLGIGSTSISAVGSYRVLDLNHTTGGYLSLSAGGTRTGAIYSSASATGIESIGATYIQFLTNSAERARIDSSGNLLVGTTSTGFQNNNSVTVQGPAGYVLCNHVDGTGSGAVYAGFAYNGSGIGSITQSGTTAVLYNTTSDQRLKENIVDAPEFGSVIDAIKVRSYDWKSDQTHQRAGFVAQELVTVAPEAVHQPADPEEMMAVDYSKLVPMLVKEIQSLRARVAALES